MTTKQQLEAKRNQLESQEGPLRNKLKQLEDSENPLFQKQRQISTEIREQRAIVQDPAATAAQKDAATDRGTELEQQYNQINIQLRTIQDQKEEVSRQIRDIDEQLVTVTRQIELADQARSTATPPSGTWKIERDANTGLWVVLFEGINLKSLPGGNRLGRGDSPIIAINLAIQKIDQVNDPVTGAGPGSVPPLTAAVREQLLSQAAAIEAEERRQFERGQQDQGPGTVSTGETTAQAQTARDDGAAAQNPPTPVQIEGRVGNNISNASTTSTQPTTGVNDATRPGTTTQAVPSPTAATPIARGGTPTNPQTASAQNTAQQNNSAPRTGGTAAREDSGDTAEGAANPVQVLAGRTPRQVVPQANVLDQYSSYTYSISIYLMSPEDYRRLMQSREKFIPGYLLLMQSAGAPTSSGITPQAGVADVGEVPGQGPSLTQGRNQFFPLDYYIDDLEIEHRMPGKGTGMPHNATSMTFKIFEPNGITLLGNLYRATQQYVQRGGGASTSTQNNNYAAQNYLMVIRFYGYDQDGNILTQPTSTASGPRTDANAITEKFIPFQFTSIKFRIANRITEYSCEAVTPQNSLATAQGRGVIPYNIQLTATTLQNLFNGNLKFTQQQDNNQDTRDTQVPGGSDAPAKATAAPQPTLAQGLTQALNQYQDEFVRQQGFTVADRYEIRISHPELADSKVVPPGGVDRSTKPSVQATSAAQAKDGDKQAVQNEAKTVSITAGTSIVQFLEMAVRNSTWVIDQQKKIITRGPDGKERVINQPNPNQGLLWYRIGVQAIPIGDKIDPKRGDYAYRIIYEIAPYTINQMISDYFPRGVFRGVQKRYPYWFTGENTSVLGYEQEFNSLYYITVNSGQSFRDLPAVDMREVEKRIFSPNSAQSNQGQKGNAFEPGANAADFLYSPADLSRVKLSIVGDPAWIAQGEVWQGVRSFAPRSVQQTSDTDPYFAPFLADGTINFDAAEALFEVAFNQPADYDILTGVMQTQGSG